MIFAKVESLSHDDTWYTVWFRERTGKWQCSCPHHQYRNVICKHIKMVKKGEYDSNRIKYSDEALLWLGTKL